MEKIIFIGGFFTDNLYVHCKKFSVGPMSNANNALQWAFLNGFKELKYEIQAISLPQVASYPRGYKNLMVPKDLNVNNYRALSLGFCNFIFLKHFFRWLVLRNKLKELVDQISHNSSKIIIFIYDLDISLIKAAIENKNENIKICVIIPDLLCYTGTKSNIVYNLYNKILQKRLNKYLQFVDYYSLISENMAEKLLIKKPYCVIEGMCNNNEYLVSEKSNFQSLNKFVIFYSGAVDERNGVVHLVKAFMMLKNENYLLVICGDGYARDYVQAMSTIDKRINFQGQIARKDVLEMQKKASLLINPRLPNEDFTRYSFPSKIIEYFASGVPVFMYQLSGIPSEYYTYCYTCSDLTPEALALKISNISKLDLGQRIKLAESAKQFIFKCKNSKIQVSKLINFIKSNEANN